MANIGIIPVTRSEISGVPKTQREKRGYVNKNVVRGTTVWGTTVRVKIHSASVFRKVLKNEKQ